MKDCAHRSSRNKDKGCFQFIPIFFAMQAIAFDSGKQSPHQNPKSSTRNMYLSKRIISDRASH
jgi:hypothetical protein